MKNKPSIWTFMGVLGMILGLAGTAVQGYAEDKELDAHINEVVDKKLAEREQSEGQ